MTPGWTRRAPKLIATDLDGTLLRDDGRISERSVRALRRAHAAGARVVIATGRPLGLLPDLSLLPLGAVIGQNGAVVRESLEGAVRVRGVIDGSVLRELRERLDPLWSARMAVQRVVEGRDELLAEHEFSRRGGYALGDLEDITADGAVRALVQHAGASEDFVDVVHRLAGGRVVATFSTQDGLVELTASGTGKAAALAEYAASRGLAAEDVLAFGDMPNDVDMLRWAGCGVAMGNAHPAAKSAARLVTASNEEDGLALVLESIWGDD